MFCSQFHPLVGGAERQAELLARGLGRVGCRVEVLTPRIDPAWPEYEVLDGLPVRRFALTDLARRFPGWRGLGIPNLLVERAQVRRAVRAHLAEFDLLHAHVASPLVVFAMDAAHGMGRPVLCKIAGGGIGFDFEFLRGVSVLGTWLERAAVRRMDCWVAISKQVRENLLRAGVQEDRIVSISNGIDTEVWGPARVRERVRRFLCLGQMGKFDIETLLAAFDQLAVDHPDVELRLVGRGDAGMLQARLATHPRARERTRIAGVSPAGPEFAWADALVHPSFVEGLSNTLLEAMTCGTPCVASDILPNRELLAGGEAGLLAPLGDVEALANALRRIVDEPGLARRLAITARRRIDESYSLRSVAARYLALYDRLRSATSDGVAPQPSRAS